MLVARAATCDARGVTSSRASRSRSRCTRVPRARHVVARVVSRELNDDAHIHLSVVARVSDAHAGAVLALAAVDDPDPDARFPWFVSTSVDGTVSTWHVEERGAGGIELVRDASFGDDDAPWWCLAVDDQWLFAGTHGRKVKVRLAVDAHLEKLPGAIANHTGWVRALASVRKTPGELERSRAPDSTDASATTPTTEDAPPPPTTGDAWRFSAACNVVRVWQDSLAFDEDDDADGETDDENDGAVADVCSARIFAGDILCLAGVQTPSRTEHPHGRGDRFLVAGVADGTVRSWRVCEARGAEKRDAPVMLPVRERESDAGGSAEKVANLRGGRVAALFPLAEAFPGDGALARFVVAGCRDGTLGCVDAETLGVSPRVAAHGKRTETTRSKGVACVCPGPGNTVASGGDDGIVRLWRARAESRAAPGSSLDGSDVVRLEPAGSSLRGDRDDDARDEEKKEKSTRALCAAREKTSDASGARVFVLAGDEAGGLALYAPEPSS